MSFIDVDERSQERRASLRVPLDTPLFITLEKESGGPAHTALVEDFSRGGVRLELPHSDGEEVDWNQVVVRIQGLPGPFEDKKILGTICWVRDGQCGVRFHKELPVSDAELTAIVLGL